MTLAVANGAIATRRHVTAVTAAVSVVSVVRQPQPLANNRYCHCRYLQRHSPHPQLSAPPLFCLGPPEI